MLHFRRKILLKDKYDYAKFRGKILLKDMHGYALLQKQNAVEGYVHVFSTSEATCGWGLCKIILSLEAKILLKDMDDYAALQMQKAVEDYVRLCLL